MGLFAKLSGQPQSYARKQNYIFGQTLGAGSFGIVRCARDKFTNEEVAIKIILKKTLKGNEQVVIDEIKMLQNLHHDHIIGFRDWFESRDKFYIVTQLATGGELFDRIIAKGRFTEHDASLVVVEMLEAIAYLHDQDIIHRDLKPENVMYLTPEDNSNIVIVDFGIAKKLNGSDDLLNNSAGTFGYAAPEVFTSGHGKPCDIWSLGVITYTLLSGLQPFRAQNGRDFIEETKNNNGVIFYSDYWSDVSKDARRFIIKALQLNPKDRPTAKELLQDPWLVSIASEHKETDLLPNLKKFDARAKFRQAIMMVKLNNRIKKLKEVQTEHDDDPTEINLYSKSGSLFHDSEELTKSDGGIDSLRKLSDIINNMDTGLSKASVSNVKSPYGDSVSKKETLRTDAFVQLVQTASENRERVKSFKDDGTDAPIEPEK
ncbi:kinase-like domain-containing protein [Scheffersomyces coipomensis]|uniref:kinase-like domain-containing protein n=1 Tax=Scheffersomyces coipomensis TaxID=1788519 RepID=UPI00315D7CDF